jgi:hypothetical protein
MISASIRVVKVSNYFDDGILATGLALAVMFFALT